MNINEFPRHDIETIISLYNGIAQTEGKATPALVSSAHIPPHHQLIVVLDATNFTQVFDYEKWADSFGWDKVMDPATLDTADFDTLQKLITTHIRTNRFLGGHWDSLQAQGYLSRFIRRLQELYTASNGSEQEPPLQL